MSEITPNNGNGWTTWSKHVLAELERLDKEMNELNRCFIEIKVQVATLHVKSGFWGAVAAIVSIGVIMGITWLRGGK